MAPVKAWRRFSVSCGLRLCFNLRRLLVLGLWFYFHFLCLLVLSSNAFRSFAPYIFQHSSQVFSSFGHFFSNVAVLGSLKYFKVTLLNLLLERKSRFLAWRDFTAWGYIWHSKFWIYLNISCRFKPFFQRRVNKLHTVAAVVGPGLRPRFLI